MEDTYELCQRDGKVWRVLNTGTKEKMLEYVRSCTIRHSWFNGEEVVLYRVSRTAEAVFKASVNITEEML